MKNMLAELPFALPVVEFNGGFLTDLNSGTHHWVEAIDSDVSRDVFEFIRERGQHPLLSTFDGTRDQLYFGACENEGMAWYLRDREEYGDAKLRRVDDAACGLGDLVACITTIGEGEPLLRIETEIGARWGDHVETHCFDNRYSRGWFWLTVHSVKATKDRAVGRLKELLSAEEVEVVAFGDGDNDASMIRSADRGIAVGNAVPEVLEAAAEVIGPNTDDSVARYIEADWISRNGRVP